jgi:hypothetical protein
MKEYMRAKMRPGQEYLNLLEKQKAAHAEERAVQQFVLQEELKAGVVNLTGGLTQNAVKALAAQAGIGYENMALIAPNLSDIQKKNLKIFFFAFYFLFI